MGRADAPETRDARRRLQSWLDRLARAIRSRLVEGADWRPQLLLLLVLAVDYAERTLIGALGPTLERVFHFDNTTLGLLATASNIVAAIATVPFGLLTDRTRRTTLLAASLAIWAAGVGLAGASVSLAMFFAARLLLGGVAAVTGPAVPSLIGDIVPAAYRARAFGLVESGQLVGSGLGFILAAAVTAFVSFRWCFWVLGLAGAIVALAFRRLPEPERTGAAGPAAGGDGEGQEEGIEQRLVQEEGIEPSPPAVLREDPDQVSLWDAARYTLHVHTAVIMMISRAVGDFFLAAIGTFGVLFATQQYGISQGAADLAILVLGVGALAGFLLVGRVCDILLRKRHLNSRIWLGALAYILGPLPLFFALRTHTLAIALPLFVSGAFAIAGAGPALDAVHVDVLVPRLRGRTEAIRQLLRTLAEGGAPAMVGVISGVVGRHAAGLQLAFIVTLPALVASGLIALIALRTYGPDIAAALASTDRGADNGTDGYGHE